MDIDRSGFDKAIREVGLPAGAGEALWSALSRRQSPAPTRGLEYHQHRQALDERVQRMTPEWLRSRLPSARAAAAGGTTGAIAKQ